MQIKDSSNDARDLSIFLNQSPSRGKLVCGLQYCTSDQMLLKSLKPIQYKKGANLTYIRTDTINQHFSLPNVDWLGNPLVNPAEQISTKIYLNDNTYVADAIYSIDIINVNDASDISISWKTIPPIYAYGSNTKKNEALSYFILSDITINDPDQGVDLVRISISTTNRGMIMLNNSLPFNYYKSSVFLSSTDIYCKSANWSCEGEYETAARRFSFVSTVSAALALLNGAKYYSLRGNIDDTITIAVYDGVGKDCLTAVAHGSANPTIRQGCFTSSLSLNVSSPYDKYHLKYSISDHNVIDTSK